MDSQEDNLQFNSNHFSSFTRAFVPIKQLAAGSNSYPTSSSFCPSTMSPKNKGSLIEKNDFGLKKNDSTEKMNFPLETK